MEATPETVDPKLLQQLRAHILAKYGQAMLDAISPRREPGPATKRLLELAKEDLYPDELSLGFNAISAAFLAEHSPATPEPDTDEWRPR